MEAVKGEGPALVHLRHKVGGHHALQAQRSLPAPDAEDPHDKRRERSAQELMNAGFRGARELKELERAGFSAQELKDAASVRRS
eukprot:328858-Heterocapsa_arctica.AAC.1